MQLIEVLDTFDFAREDALEVYHAISPHAFRDRVKDLIERSGTQGKFSLQRCVEQK